MRSGIIAIVSVCLFFTVDSYSQKVVESASEIVFRSDAAVVRLAVDGEKALGSVNARVSLIDVMGNERSSANESVPVGAGRQIIQLQLPIGSLTADENADLAWYRLRYQVGSSAGTISVSQIAKELFELRVVSSGQVMSGMNYRVRVRSLDPVTGGPASGVAITTELAIDEPGESTGKIKYFATGTTGRDGSAVLDFPIAAETVMGGEGKITVVGRRNGLVREATDDVNALENDVQFLMMTDKPLYQPGQTLNIRGIVFKGGEGKTVLADSLVEFRILDEDDTLVYREKVRSSGFGVAAIGWRIPPNIKLGEFSIQVFDENRGQIGGTRARVSRYDLPNFAVRAKPDKPYYLPRNKTAEIEVRADYLFGKPVPRGKVRVVEETDREWNYKEQKYEIDEGAVREGELDADGKFIARFDLREHHEEIEDDDWRKYRDIQFAAYLTDPTTNKTEQRRFDVRISREPIHVYFVNSGEDYNPKLPVTGYVSTFYADGTPAECTVEIKASEDDEERYQTVATTNTNRYGAGKYSFPRPRIGDSDDDLDFQAIATDSAGRRGTGTDEYVSFDEDDHAIHITTDKSIYKPGETVSVSLRSTIKSGVVYLDVVKGWSVIDSRFVQLDKGKAEIRLPYNESFKGELKVAVFAEDPDDESSLVKATRGIIFPAREAITVDATFDKAVYKPNEEATVSLGVVDAIGQALESTLGIVIIDKAVEERARTDNEFGQMFRDIGGWLGYGDGFGGINVKDLNELDLTKPISPEMQLVAEVILHDEYYYPNFFHSKNYFDEAKTVFAATTAAQFDGVRKVLTETYANNGFDHPTDEASLDRILKAGGIDISAMRDPWETEYAVSFSISKAVNVVTVTSAGPDKVAGTRDDFTVFSQSFSYFTPTGQAIDAAVRSYHAGTGGFVRDAATLYAELGVTDIKDRWGRPYRIEFSGDGRFIEMRLRSVGPDGKYEERYWRGDDFQIWENKQDFLEPLEKKIRSIQEAVSSVPMTEAAFREQLNAGGVTEEMLRDANGKPLYINAVQTSRFWDKVTFETVQVFGETERVEKRVVTPVTQQIMQFTIRGPGRDGVTGNHDDINVMQVVHVLSEQTKDDPAPVPVIQKISYTRSNGSIAGVVRDMNGAVVPAATVTATGADNGITRATTTDDSGRYLIGGLPAGSYSVRVSFTGFKDAVVSAIPVKANTTAQVDLTLEAGDISAVVEVTGSRESIDTVNASLVTVSSQQVESLPLSSAKAMNLVALQPGVAKGADEKSTPRVREYFPETLLWRPEVVTNSDGRAEVKFRMADNITTWKMYTIASTKNGKVGFAEKEVTAFQSFFVDLDPPKFLTDGDEIFLPTQVRNYTEKRQKVDVTMSPADWFSFIDGEKKQVDVASGQAENAVFGFRAVRPVSEGKQRVTAMAETDSDAIERPVTVRPDGREVVNTESRYFSGNETIDLNFPANALPRTERAELKIYPNLMAHVVESVEGLLRRPYGCGEQTISSTYPNLMILKFAGAGGTRRIGEKTERDARKNLQDGYDRLVGYQVASGGFSYWGGKDEADLALTAYAIRFLKDAEEFVAVDPSIVRRAEEWLIGQQRADGSWNTKYRWEEKENDARAKMLTTYIARTLALITSNSAPVPQSAEPRSGEASKGTSDAAQSAKETPLAKALRYLKIRNAKIDDPYSLALLGLAAHDAGDAELAGHIAEKLTALGRDESGGTYWNLESNTAFNGWGTAGRIETTALVTQLLMKRNGAKGFDDLIGKAMIFLLKNKDRYGVWYSTQTTINVLDTFLTSLAGSGDASTPTVQVLVNGTPVRSVEIGPDKLDQIIVDLNAQIAPGVNRVEIRGANGSPMMTQLVANHYVSWDDSDASSRNVNTSRAIELKYDCDRTDTAIMQEVSCTVSAERVGFRGYGMLLAEIGTPPGADVSREALQAAMDEDWSISKYEVLPDRVIVYMWAKAGGTKFDLKFRPRYGINAQTPASVVYDYYNPEAQAVREPIRFNVK